MTSSERAKLRSLAMTVEPVVTVGKNGITDTLIQEIDEQLEAKELIKINVLKNADFGAKDVIGEIAESVNAQPVQALGNKITLYRKSKKDIKHIL
ncbi:MAG: ribosome assembly RNA-binding protein YhbY [Christensenellales bacterium]